MKINRRAAGLLAGLALCLGATAADCQKAEMSGTVVKHTFDGNEKDGIRFLIKVRTAHGDRLVRITAAQWSRCTVGAMYPACLDSNLKKA